MIEGFEKIETGDGFLLIREDLALAWQSCLYQRLQEMETLESAIVRRGDFRMLSWKTPEGEARGILKRFRRGGLFGPLRGTYYLGLGRPLREIRLSEDAHREGLPVPRALALRARTVGGILYRFSLLRELLPEARPLREGFLDGFRSAGQPAAPAGPASALRATAGRREILRAAAQAIRKFHDAGFLHRDLHVGNLLVQPARQSLGEGGSNGKAGLRVHVFDLDRSERVRTLGEPARWGELARLYRSFHKDPALAASISRDDWKDFLAEYWSPTTLPPEEMSRWLQRFHRHLELHRLWWRWSKP